MKKGWKIIKLSECLKHINTGLNPRNNFILGNGRIKYITAKNLTRTGTIDFSKCDYIDEKARDIIHRRSDIEIGDILFSSRAPIGQCHLITQTPDYYEIGESIFSLRVKKDVILPEYLCLYLTSDYFVELASKNTTGSIIKEIRIGNLLDTLIIVPTREEQEHIASLFNSIDKKIENNNKINDNLSEQIQLLYSHQFNLHSNPESWKSGILADIADITMGQSPAGDTYNSSGYGSPFYQGSTDFGVYFPLIRMFTTQPTRFASTLDTLLSVRAPVGSLNIAFEDCCIGRGLAAIHGKYNNNTFVRYLLKNNRWYFDNINNSGTTFGSITKDYLHGMPVIIPDAESVASFEKRANLMEQQIYANERQIRELQHLRDWLMPMFMSGQAKVVD